MKFARLGSKGAERPAVIVEDETYDLSNFCSDIDGEFFEQDGMAAVRQALQGGRLRRLAGASELRIGAPIARPGAVICIGMNYAAHAVEAGGEPPSAPIMFLKTPNTVSGPNDPVTIPRGSRQTDWEVELGVVIASRASYLDGPGVARKHVAGFVLANDLSEREFQLQASGGQWSKGKCAAGFNPLGPWLVASSELDDRELRLRSWVNGEPRQDSTTADLIFGVDYLIWHLSQFLVLEPGDLILTGTPAGVALSGRFPYLGPGDVVEMEIDGLGRQRQEYLAP